MCTFNRAITCMQKRDEKKLFTHQRDSILQLFLMHLDDIVPNVAADGAQGNTQPVGCSSIICNHPGQVHMPRSPSLIAEQLFIPTKEMTFFIKRGRSESYVTILLDTRREKLQVSLCRIFAEIYNAVLLNCATLF